MAGLIHRRGGGPPPVGQLNGPRLMARFANAERASGFDPPHPTRKVHRLPPVRLGRWIFREKLSQILRPPIENRLENFKFRISSFKFSGSCSIRVPSVFLPW